MAIRLRVQKRGADSRLLELESTAITIGRSSGNEVVIDDPRASRRHCRLVETPQGVVLEDLQSANGTCMGGERITRAILGPGDEFRVGKTRFTYDPTAPSSGESAAVAAGGEAGSLETSERARRDPAARESSTGDRANVPSGSPSPAAEVLAWLEVVGGPREGTRIEIAGLPFTLGRARESSFRLNDPRCSSRHARIVRDGEALVIEDAGSKNGILVGGRKTSRGELVTGTRIVLGGMVFVATVPGTRAAPSPSPGAIEEAQEGAEPVLARARVDRALASGGGQQPLLVAALVAVVCLSSFLAIDLARRVLIVPELDPRADENLVLDNWSFERTEAESSGNAEETVPGWGIVEGDQGTIERTTELAQYPGRHALRVRSEAPALCRVGQKTEVPLAGARAYRLEGFVALRGSGFAGLLVEWRRESRGNVETVGRTFSECLNDPGEKVTILGRVVSPVGASHARISCVAYGEGTEATFDRITFVPDPEESARASAAPRLEIGDDERGRFGLDFGRDGRLALWTRARVLFPAAWAGLPPERDPDAFGPILRPAQVREAEGGGYRISTVVPDSQGAKWVRLETLLRVANTEISLRCRVDGDVAPSGAVAPNLYLEAADASLALVVHGGGENREATIEELEDTAGVGEIVAGSGRERVSLVFSRTVRVSVRDDPVRSSRRLLVVEARPGDKELRVDLVPGARREKQAAQLLVQEAESRWRRGEAAAARALLQALPTRYPEQRDVGERAERLVAQWNVEVGARRRRFSAAIDAYRNRPSELARDALVRRGRAVAREFRGTPDGEWFAARVSEVESFWAKRLENLREQERQDRIKLALEHYRAGRRGLAELYARLVAEAAPQGSEAARRAAVLLGRIEKWRDTERQKLLLP